ncbi:MAG: class I SAM-dependent methyltransferase [Pseudomonadota bacterium]
MGKQAVPCEALLRVQHLLPRRGVALDLACGLGGNAVWLARRGLQVYAVDWSQEAIDALRVAHAGPKLQCHHVDLHAFDWPVQTCDVVVVSRFLDRSLCAAMSASLAPGGYLVYQTFVGPYVGHGPRSPEYRLDAGELPGLFPGLTPVEYDPDGSVVPGYALLISRKPLAKA